MPLIAVILQRDGVRDRRLTRCSGACKAEVHRNKQQWDTALNRADRHLRLSSEPHQGFPRTTVGKSPAMCPGRLSSLHSKKPPKHLLILLSLGFQNAGWCMFYFIAREPGAKTCSQKLQGHPTTSWGHCTFHDLALLQGAWHLLTWDTICMISEGRMHVTAEQLVRMHLIGSKGCFVDTDCNKLNQIENKSPYGSMAPAFSIQAIYWKERNKELNKQKSKVKSNHEMF